MMSYKITISGVAGDGFTSAWIEDEDENHLGRVFELEDGWYIHVQDPDRLRDREFVDTIFLARDELFHYINRKGLDLSDGEWSPVGISLLLMQRDDDKGYFSIKSDEDQQV
jgi:hypothetical protein